MGTAGVSVIVGKGVALGTSVSDGTTKVGNTVGTISGAGWGKKSGQLQANNAMANASAADISLVFINFSKMVTKVLIC
jgi:hypothetical protein